MKKKCFVLSAVMVLIIVISFGLGYVYAYIHVLAKVMDMQVSTYSEILLTNSLVLTEKLKSPDITGLIEATEQNGNSLYDFIISYEPIIEDPVTLKHNEISLIKWEQAKKRLQELRILQETKDVGSVEKGKKDRI